MQNICCLPLTSEFSTRVIFKFHTSTYLPSTYNMVTTHPQLALNESLSDEKLSILLARSSNNAFGFWLRPLYHLLIVSRLSKRKVTFQHLLEHGAIASSFAWSLLQNLVSSFLPSSSGWCKVWMKTCYKTLKVQPHRHLVHASIISFFTSTIIISFLAPCLATFFMGVMVAVINSHYTLQK